MHPLDDVSLERCVLGRCVPGMMCTLDDVSVPWTMRPWDDVYLWWWVPWMMCPLDDVSLGWCVPIRSTTYWVRGADIMTIEAGDRHSWCPCVGIGEQSLGFLGWPARHQGITQASVSSSCDHPSFVCGLGSGHFGQGNFVQGTHWPRDASSKENIWGHLSQGHRIFPYIYLHLLVQTVHIYFMTCKNILYRIIIVQ